MGSNVKVRNLGSMSKTVLQRGPTKDLDVIGLDPPIWIRVPSNRVRFFFFLKNGKAIFYLVCKYGVLYIGI